MESTNRKSNSAGESGGAGFSYHHGLAGLPGKVDLLQYCLTRSFRHLLSSSLQTNDDSPYIWSEITMLIAPERSRTARQKAKSDLLHLPWILGNSIREDIPRQEVTGNTVSLCMTALSLEPDVKDH